MKRKTTKASHFAVCINNEGYKASLEVGKLYRMIPEFGGVTSCIVQVWPWSIE